MRLKLNRWFIRVGACVLISALFGGFVAFLIAIQEFNYSSSYFHNVCIVLPEGVEGDRVVKARDGVPVLYCDYNYPWLFASAIPAFLAALVLSLAAMLVVVGIRWADAKARQSRPE